MLQATDIEIRSPERGELKEFLTTVEAAFGHEPKDEDVERWSRVIEPERMLWASDGDLRVGSAGAWTFSLTVPGGELPTAGVTVVGVLPSHRRRGLLTRMMRLQLDDVRERGEPLAALWASEASIYGRFGYGVATRSATIEVERDRAVFRDATHPVGRTRIVSLQQAVDILPDVYDRVRTATPGMLTRSRDWWEVARLADPEHGRNGGGPLFCAVHEIDGRPEAYALYRSVESWEDGVPKSKLRIREVMATSPLATTEIWRFLFGVDLIDRVRASLLPPDHPLFLMLTEPRRLRLSVSDGLWLRLVDLEAALGARSYAADGSIRFEVRDAFCPSNEGMWQLDSADGRGVATRTESGGDLRLDAADLASAYLGGFTFAELARAGRVEEVTPGGLEQADELFRVSVTPWCPEEF